MKTFIRHGRYVVEAILLLAIAAVLVIAGPHQAHAQTVGTYVEGSTGNTKQGIGVALLPPVPGATGIAVPSTPLSGNTSGTPSTYTTIQAATVGRAGCTIINTSTNTENIRTGGVSGAVMPLLPNQAFGCKISGIDAAISDQIEINSAVATQAYYANFQ